MNQFRKPAVAGLFYPSNALQLRETVEGLLSKNFSANLFPSLSGMVAPHAGYKYSGTTAAFAYNQIKGKDFNRVVILSPSHREYFPGISIYPGIAYQTPLGDVEIDKQLADEITDNEELIYFDEEGHRQEHGIEVHLPFLQIVLSNFKIVPIVMGDQKKIYVDALAKKLSKVVDEKTLIIASSDLSHFYQKKIATKLDDIVAKRIAEFNFEKLEEELEKNICEACGGGLIVSMLKGLNNAGKTKAKILHRSDSSDVSMDESEVVGYLSAAIYN